MNKVLEKVLKGGVAYGTWVTIPHPEVPEILSNLPFDWLLFDMEHAPIDVEKLELMLMPLRGSGVVPFVRVPWNDMVVIKRVLDLGVGGLMVPYVNNKREAEELVSACKYPPEGVRGVGPRRAAGYGFKDITRYYRESFNEVVKIAQVETTEALENLEEILDVNGLDGVFIGPNDLTASLGVFREFDDERYRRALERVVKEARRRNKIAGIMTEGVEDVVDKVSLGFNFISIASDVWALTTGFKNTLREASIGQAPKADHPR